MNPDRIAVIIPFFNRKQSLLETLRRVEAQTVPPTQLILVDDGSTDQGAEEVTAWLKQLGRRFDCRLLRKTNGGAAAARNYGLSMSQPSEYVAFLDSDDHWPSDFLERTKAALASQPTAVAATCDRRYVFADGRRSKWEDCSAITNVPSIWLLERGAGVGSCTLLRRDAVERQGGYDEGLPTGHDAALYLPLSLYGPWLHVTGQPVEFSIGSSSQRIGDEGNLSSKYADNQLAWVQIYSEFFVHGGQAWSSHPRVRRMLAKRWYYAGRQLFRLGEYRRALTCFRKSQAWKPWKAKSYGYAWRAWVALHGRKMTNSNAPRSTPAPTLVHRAA